jgi:SAM-dependent methyltransferase
VVVLAALVFISWRRGWLSSQLVLLTLPSASATIALGEAESERCSDAPELTKERRTMPLPSTIFDVSLAEARSRYFGPCVLSPFADDLAGRLSRMTAAPLLEIMADIGTLTQAIAAAVSVGVSVIATEPDAALLAVAAAKPGTARVTWREAHPAALPFDDASFGSVACLFGLAETADRVQTFRELRRVLKPGGRLMFTTFAPLRQNPIAACVQATLTQNFPDAPPRYLPGVLHGYGDPEIIDDDLTSAGFTDAAYTIVELPFSARSASETALGYLLGTRLRTELENLAGGAMLAVIEAVEADLRQRFGNGRITASMRANVVSAGG